MSGQSASGWLPGLQVPPADGRFTCPECPTCRDTHERGAYHKSREDTATVLRCPGCGCSFRPLDDQTIHADLTAALARYRHSEFAAVMARALCRYESGTREFVGVTAEAEKALYATPEAGVVYAVSFDKHGLGAVDTTLARAVRDAGAWVDQYGRDLLWVHPRYERGCV